MFKKLQEDDKINDEAASSGNEEVNTDLKLKEETENQMMKEVEILNQEKQALKKAELALNKAKKAYSAAHKECTTKSIARSKKAIAESQASAEGPSKDGSHANEIVISEFDTSSRMKDNTCFYIKTAGKD